MAEGQWQSRRVLFLILVLTFLAFLPALYCGFVNWDDSSHLLENVKIRILDFEHVKEIFTSFVNRTYIPLPTLSYALEYHFFKFDPVVYHLTNLFLHLAVVGLIFVLALRLGLSFFAAVFAALIFGIHPMHVESVVWVTGRKDVLYSLFYLLALNSYCQYLDYKKKRFYILVFIFGFLSILSKPMALSLPLVLLACDWFKGRPLNRKIFLEKCPIFIYIIPIAALTYIHHARIPWQNPADAILIWIWTVTFYLRKFFIPLHLSPLYQIPQPVEWNSPHYLSALAVFFTCLGMIYYFRKNKLFLFAFLYYFFSIFFLLRFDDHLDLTIVADRFMYLPSLGFCLFLGNCLAGLKNRFNTARIPLRFINFLGCALLLIFLGMRTYQQCWVWKDGLALWGRAIEHFALQSQHSPSLAFAYHGWGSYYSQREITPLAIIYFNKAIENNPSFKDAYNNRGLAYLKLGQYPLAMEDFNKAIGLAPQEAEGYINRGMVHIMLYQDDLALEEFKKAVDWDPRYAKAYNNIGNYYLSRGDFDLAREAYDQALKFDPDFIDVFVNKGVLHQMKGEYELAEESFTQAIRREPSHHLAYVFRGNTYLDMGEFDQALKDYQKALLFSPADSFVHYKLSRLFKEKGNLEKAKEELLWSQSLGYKGNPAYSKELDTFSQN